MGWGGWESGGEASEEGERAAGGGARGSAPGAARACSAHLAPRGAHRQRPALARQAASGRGTGRGGTPAIPARPRRHSRAKRTRGRGAHRASPDLGADAMARTGVLGRPWAEGERSAVAGTADGARGGCP